MHPTLFVNLYAAEGCGKSVTRAFLYGELSLRGIVAEEIHEFAKPCVWRRDHVALEDQQFVSANQLHSYHVLDGQVEVAISDSPPLLGPILYPRKCADNPHVARYIAHEMERYDCLNVLIERPAEHAFQSEGRLHDDATARRNDAILKAALLDLGVRHDAVPLGPETVPTIVRAVTSRLGVRSGDGLQVPPR